MKMTVNDTYRALGNVSDEVADIHFQATAIWASLAYSEEEHSQLCWGTTPQRYRSTFGEVHSAETIRSCWTNIGITRWLENALSAINHGVSTYWNEARAKILAFHWHTNYCTNKNHHMHTQGKYSCSTRVRKVEWYLTLSLNSIYIVLYYLYIWKHL